MGRISLRLYLGKLGTPLQRTTNRKPNPTQRIGSDCWNSVLEASSVGWPADPVVVMLVKAMPVVLLAGGGHSASLHCHVDVGV